MLSDARRIVIELPTGEMTTVADGDAWFSLLPLARGHIAFDKKQALVVDLTGPNPQVRVLDAGDESTFGGYAIELGPSGAVLHIRAHLDTGPDRSRPAVKQQA